MERIASSASDYDDFACGQSVVRETFALPSADGRTMVAGELWMPPASVKPMLLVQLIHGMAEHILRYDAFARFLVAHGCAVVGHDHIGHGRSVPADVSPQQSWGVLTPNEGAEHLIADVQSVRLWADERFPAIPHVMFGHSMGSFVLRAFLGQHGSGLAGAIVCGTGWQPPAALVAGRLLASVIGHACGWDCRSGLVDSMAIGAYARAFADAEGEELAWLTRDESHRDRYRNDPAAGFMFSVSAYHELFRLVSMAQDARIAQGIPAQLPIILVAGADDPVGAMGKAVPKVADFIVSCGVQDVECKLYPGARHEILNETNADEVMDDMVAWLCRKGLIHG